jgi:hypothetical protein
MSAQAIYNAAPLGALVRFSDGKPKPPSRFTKKLASWERSNGVGRLIRKTPPFVRGSYAGGATITLHEGDFASGDVVLVTIQRTHGIDSELRFEVIGTTKPGSWRIVRPYGETVELLHLAEDRAAADAWLRRHRHSDARVEPVGGLGQEFAAAIVDAHPAASLAREGV